MSTLLLQLPTRPAHPSTAYSYVLTSDGQSVLAQASTTAAQLPQPQGAGAHIVAIIPLQALSWQQVQLPPGIGLSTQTANPRLRAALEGLLEDKLLQEPAQVHFALAPEARAGAPLWVAVCQRDWLTGHLQALEAADRPVARIVPAWAPQENNLPAVCALGTPEAPQLVIANYDAQGAVALLPLSSATLSMVSASSTDTNSTEPEDTPLHAEPAVAALVEQLSGRSATIITPATLMLQASRSSWDLAQFDLTSSGRNRAARKLGNLWNSLLHSPTWRAARWGAVACAVAYLAGLNLWAWQEKRALQAKEKALSTIVTSTFAHIPLVVKPVLQMQREVALLQQATGSPSAQDFEPMLAALGQALPPGQHITQLIYSGTELTVKGVTLEADPLASVQNLLQAAGYPTRSEDSALVIKANTTP